MQEVCNSGSGDDANFLHWGIAAVNAMVVSAIFFFIGELTGANK